MATQKVPETPLPAPGQSDEAAHAAISRRFREHSVIEIEKGNRLQASEKIWAAVAQQLKAVAEDRGWANPSHQHLRDVALQLFRETGDQRIRLLFQSVESMHTNFYENEQAWDTIEEAWVDAEELVEKLEAIRGQRPSRFTPRNESDQARLALLMGYDLRRLNAANRQAVLDRFPLGQPSDMGFSPRYGYRPPDSNGSDNGEHQRPVTRQVGRRVPSFPARVRLPRYHHAGKSRPAVWQRKPAGTVNQPLAGPPTPAKRHRRKHPGNPRTTPFCGRERREEGSNYPLIPHLLLVPR